MKSGKLVILLVSFFVFVSFQTLAQSHRGVDFFFSQARGQKCSEAHAAYEAFEYKLIQDVGYGSFDITGSLSNSENILIKIGRAHV